METPHLFILFLVTCQGVDAQIVTFPRCNSDTLTMDFVYANPAQDPYDLFATTRRSTCGKRAGTTTGNGSYADPYVISVDLSGGLTSQSPDCGVVQSSPGSYTLTVSAVFSCEGTTANDADYTLQCDLTLPTTSPSTTVTSQSASYTCQAPSTIVFTYSQTSVSPPSDIYPTGSQTTCSLSANQGTGSGITGDPYVLEIDVSGATNPCGVTLTDTNTYSVAMYVQQIADIITSSDVSYALTCNFTSLANQIISTETLTASGNAANGVASLNQPSASLYVVSATSGAVLSSFAVGDPIRLTASLLDGPATGLRVRQCTASPGPGLTPQLAILDDNGCSVGSSLVPPFIGQSPAGSEALTDSFEAFRFSGYDTVFFECVADFCYGENDLACLGTHCDSAGRRKRDARLLTNGTFTPDVITAYVIVRSGMPANLTAEATKAEIHQGHNYSQWPKTYIVVVASLGCACAALLLLSVGLGVQIVFLKSPKFKGQQGQGHSAQSQPVKLTG